ncbi:MAG: hypothetical protein MUO26_10715 [Methanotrichaceae archaeon]|nr:hypothetical protein [Methanotrichaceae archaeon]
MPAISSQTPSIFLWIHGDTSWTYYEAVPQDANVELLVDYAYADKESPGKLLEIYSSSPYRQPDPSIYTEGNYKTTDYIFNPGYTQIPFSCYDKGLYYLMCTLNDQYGNVIQSSNIVTINVV